MTVLTASSSIGTWLDDPTGGPLIRGLLAAGGGDESQLATIRNLPLSTMVEMSQGQLPRSVVDDLVRQANGGELPEADEVPGEPSVPGRFAGRTVIVTGAGSGIGKAVATRVHREGGRVVAVDIAADRLTTLAGELDGVVTVAGDLARQEDVDVIVAAAGDTVDALANVAGIMDDFSALHEMPDAVWSRVIAVNLEGVMRLSRAVLPGMIAAGRGSIVNVTSEAGLRGNAAGAAYTTSKHAVIGLTRSCAFMYGPKGVRVNAVAPGAVATGIAIPPDVGAYGMDRVGGFLAAIPGAALAWHLAASITFLLSDDGVNVNGAILPSDGGWSVQ